MIFVAPKYDKDDDDASFGPDDDDDDVAESANRVSDSSLDFDDNSWLHWPSLPDTASNNFHRCSDKKPNLPLLLSNNLHAPLNRNQIITTITCHTFKTQTTKYKIFFKSHRT